MIPQARRGLFVLFLAFYYFKSMAQCVGVCPDGTVCPGNCGCLDPQCGGGLSVKLITFSGECHIGKVKLQWSTATETNNDYFTVERCSATITTGSITWEAIGTVAPASSGGNSSTIRNYSFTDQLSTLQLSNLPTVYYRLKQTDFDGKYKYFDPIVIENCAGFAISPNPAGNELNIRFFSETDDEIILEVYDVLGKLIISQTAPVVKGGNLLTLDISAAAEGMYLLRVKSTTIAVGAAAVNKKIIKQQGSNR